MLLEAIRNCIPSLSHSLRKGQCGRVAVVGGCEDYTGAPYYAGISAAKAGADLVFIFCSKGAAIPIKCYSPELMVSPVLDNPDLIIINNNNHNNNNTAISSLLSRVHCVVVGPGLGRDELLQKSANIFISEAKKLNLPIVIDADGLQLISPSSLNGGGIIGYRSCILTPNAIEFTRLKEKFLTSNEISAMSSDVEEVRQLAAKLGNVTIVKKGKIDIISDGNDSITCDEIGSPRRCGGQGDILSGTLAIFAQWTSQQSQQSQQSQLLISQQSQSQSQSQSQQQLHLKMNPMVLAGYAACLLTKKCAEAAYQKHKRSTTSPDIIACIGDVFETLFPSNSQSSNL